MTLDWNKASAAAERITWLVTDASYKAPELVDCLAASVANVAEQLRVIASALKIDPPRELAVRAVLVDRELTAGEAADLARVVIAATGSERPAAILARALIAAHARIEEFQRAAGGAA